MEEWIKERLMQKALGLEAQVKGLAFRTIEELMKNYDGEFYHCINCEYVPGQRKLIKEGIREIEICSICGYRTYRLLRHKFK